MRCMTLTECCSYLFERWSMGFSLPLANQLCFRFGLWTRENLGPWAFSNHSLLGREGDCAQLGANWSTHVRDHFVTTRNRLYGVPQPAAGPLLDNAVIASHCSLREMLRLRRNQFRAIC